MTIKPHSFWSLALGPMTGTGGIHTPEPVREHADGESMKKPRNDRPPLPAAQPGSSVWCLLWVGRFTRVSTTVL